MIVLDTSVISAFAEIGRFPLLKEILSRLRTKAVIPHTVENEIIFPEAISALKENGGWIDIKKAQDFEKYLFKLHDGEAGVIALAKEHGWIADFSLCKLCGWRMHAGIADGAADL